MRLPTTGLEASQDRYTGVSRTELLLGLAASLLASVATHLASRLEPHQEHRRVPEIGDLADHAPRPVVALVSGAARERLIFSGRTATHSGAPAGASQR